MSLQGLETPNSINVLTSLLNGSGLYSSNTAVFTDQTTLAGQSRTDTTYTPGTLVSSTVLSNLTTAINLGFTAYPATLNATNLNNLLLIGSTKIPALGNTKPSTYTGAGLPATTWTSATNLARYGFARMIALLGAIEMRDVVYRSSTTDYAGTGSTLTSYQIFCQDFLTAYNFKNKTNHYINSFVNSKTFLAGVYSNMNDLITADFSGVNSSLVYWGQDLIKSGRAIDLSTIDTFGLPSNLLKTLKKNNAITEEVSIALLYADLTSSEITEISENLVTPTRSQEIKIYGAFNAVRGNDLSDVCILLNTQTTNLESLADLLDPKKLFPNSYTSLTVPKYNTTNASANSKIYYNIYASGGLSTSVPKTYGTYLSGILSTDLRVACGAFATAMMQIRNIKNMNIEKVSQVVTNLEVTNDISVNGTSIPVNVANVDSTLSTLAKGSGPNGTYQMADFFPNLCQLNYNLTRIRALILQLQTTTLLNIYLQMKNELTTPGVNTNTNMATYITNANNEINSIFNNSANTAAVTELNNLWNNLGTLMVRGNTSRSLLGYSYTQELSSLTITANTQSIYSFIDGVNGFAVDTEPGQSSQVLTQIANRTSIGGQSLIALLREIRNANRLGLIGAELDNDISDQIPVTSAGVELPRVTGETDVPGSFAGSPEVNLIPPNVDIFNISPDITAPPLTPEEALEEVILCYCDCWDNL